MWRKMMVFGALGGLMVSGSAAGRVHTIQKGETLGTIARQYGVTLSALTAANRLADPNRIMTGAVLAIPGAGPSPVATGVNASPGAACHLLELVGYE